MSKGLPLKRRIKLAKKKGNRLPDWRDIYKRDYELLFIITLIGLVIAWITILRMR